jgi:hypothetical protein
MQPKNIDELIEKAYREEWGALLYGEGLLTEIPSSIRKLKNLRSLNLANNQIREIPDWILELHNLEELNLHSNNISIIPQEIGRLTQLRVIDLRANALISLPAEIGLLTNLEFLLLGTGPAEFLYSYYGGYGNKIGDIPDTISNLKKLQILSLGGNRLEFIPDSICNLPSLTSLGLDENLISEIPNQIYQLQKLERLALGRQASEMNDSRIGLLEEDKKTELLNSFRKLNPNLFLLINLEELILCDNTIESLPKEIGNLKNLKNLDIRNNKLTTLPIEIRSLTNLDHLYLGDNLLSIPEEILDRYWEPKKIISYSFDTSKEERNEFERISNAIRDVEKERAEFKKSHYGLDYPVVTTAYPESVTKNKWYGLEIFFYLKSLSHVVANEIHKLRQQDNIDLGDVTSHINSPIPTGTQVSFIFSSPQDVLMNPSSITLRWYESYYKLPFRIYVPQDTHDDFIVLLIDVVIHGLPITKIPISISTTKQPTVNTSMVSSMNWPREVFASYSRKDSKIVRHLKRRYLALGIYMFIDVDDLRSGEYWESRLYERIDRSDVFQLFWSQQASQSRFVEKEWKHAVSLLNAKGDGFIKPIYWEDSLPSVPDELSHINFYKIGFDLDEFASDE